MTTIEIILGVALFIVTVQYSVLLYRKDRSSKSIDTAINTMEKMQDYHKELFDKLLKEEKLNLAMAHQLKEYREKAPKTSEDIIKGM